MGVGWPGTTPYAGVPGPNANMRGIPDISYQASARTGVLIYNAEEGGWFIIGGTSSGSPQWAAITSIVDQIAKRRSGNINPALYALELLPSKLNPFHDIAEVGRDTIPTDLAGARQSGAADDRHPEVQSEGSLL